MALVYTPLWFKNVAYRFKISVFYLLLYDNTIQLRLVGPELTSLGEISLVTP